MRLLLLSWKAFMLMLGVEISHAVVTLETIRNLTVVTEKCRLNIERADYHRESDVVPTQRSFIEVVGGDEGDVRVVRDSDSGDEDGDEVEIVSFSSAS